ncbi:hypothetical protein [Lentzea sp. NEAU-D7]|uniref:hypothetical protein n=1 Tax=Lentzea sp. NEAU-D7 TaxID=2994667 RepID=UPI00224AB96C|nr:hypothetical protein [Lentzea sp. NEAU-D7]MCX2952376.1 hypothetical protein [Lentzea sp. NEAU-D7]
MNKNRDSSPNRPETTQRANEEPAHPSMTWPQAAAVCATVVGGFIFDFLLIFLVTLDPLVATGLTVVLVAAIVTVIIPPRNGLLQRLSTAVQAFFTALFGSGGAR